MTSNLLNMIGLGTVDIAYFFIVILAIQIIFLILLIVQIAKTKKLKKRYEKFMQGKNAKSMEDDVAGLFQDINMLKNVSDKNKKDIRTLYKNMEKTFQKVGIVKYDAFNQMGGQLSFSLALLDENNNGFIMNSVHSTDGCYSYTKEIRKGACEIDLGEEEKEALEKAIENK